MAASFFKFKKLFWHRACKKLAALHATGYNACEICCRVPNELLSFASALAAASKSRLYAKTPRPVRSCDSRGHGGSTVMLNHRDRYTRVTADREK
jgi:hypothetical protein